MTDLIEGDIVFLGPEIVARAAKSVQIRGTALKWTFCDRAAFISADRTDPAPLPASEVYLEVIFQRGDVRIWEARVYGSTDSRAWMGDLLVPFDGKPSARPTGMVTALDLVLANLPESSMEAHQLRSMRIYFSQKAAQE